MARLLAAAAAVDNRHVTREAVAAWMQAIGHLQYPECVEALGEHRRSSTEYLQPAHIAALVTAGQVERGSVSQLDQERAALDEFVAYTGLPWRAAAERWNDREWVAEQIDVARKAYRQKALGGTA